MQRLPLSADAEVGLVQRYVESGADHRRVVASGRQTQWTGGDIVLDDAFESASPKSDLTPAAARPGGWLGATIGAIAQVYAAPATALPSPSDSSDVKTLASLPSVPLQGYYYPINSALLYDASAALLRLVWKGHHGRVDDASHPPAASSSAGQMADLLKIAEHVDELEDRNAILTAERDQARAIGV